MAPPLCFLNHPGFKTEAQIFTQRRQQIGFPLGLLKKAEYTHLRTIFGPGRDLNRAAQTELSVTRLTEIDGRELRIQTRPNCILSSREGDAVEREIRLAVVAWRRRRSSRHVAEPHAACLLPLRRDHAGENAVARTNDAAAGRSKHRGRLYAENRSRGVDRRRAVRARRPAGYDAVCRVQRRHVYAEGN